MNFTAHCVQTSSYCTCSTDKGHIAIAEIRNGIEVAQESRSETAFRVLRTP